MSLSALRGDPRRRKFLEIMALLHRELGGAYAGAQETHGLAVATIADRLGIDRAAVHRRLSGDANMTMRSLADLLWALDCDIDLRVRPATKQMPPPAAGAYRAAAPVHRTSFVIADGSASNTRADDRATDTVAA